MNNAETMTTNELEVSIRNAYRILCRTEYKYISVKVSLEDGEYCATVGHDEGKTTSLSVATKIENHALSLLYSVVILALAKQRSEAKVLLDTYYGQNGYDDGTPNQSHISAETVLRMFEAWSKKYGYCHHIRVSRQPYRWIADLTEDDKVYFSSENDTYQGAINELHEKIKLSLKEERDKLKKRIKSIDDYIGDEI